MAKTKEVQHKYQLVNIKLQTKKEGIEKAAAYEKLIKDLAHKRIHIPIAKNKHIIIYSCFDGLTESGNHYLYGNLGKGIYFDKDIIDNIDINQSEIKPTVPDKGTILDSDNSRYLFIPSVHKFVIIMNDSSVNANQIFKFMIKALAEVADNKDIVEVEVVKDPQITDNILTSFALHSLSYTISYTNDDPNGAIDKMLDNRLKKLNVGKAEIKLQADNNGAINKNEEDELIQGGVKLAEQNGIINEAVITRKEGGRKEKLLNQNTPRTFKVMADINTYTNIVVNQVVKLFTQAL